MFHTSSVRQQLCHSQSRESRLHLYFKNTQKNTQNILAVVNGCLESFEILSDCLLSHFDEFDCLGSSCFDYCRVNIGYWMWQTFKRALRNEWKWMIFEFAEHTLSITKHRGNFSIKSCVNIVVIESRERQSRKDLHTYENKHRRVIVYKSNNYKSSATWQV